MPAIKKIKRNDLAELGDEFDVLTDAEMADSGLTVADDEVIVVAKPAPVQPPGGDGDAEVGTLRSRVHTLNQESAQRRIALRDAQSQLQVLQKENSDLKKAQADRDLADTKTKAQQLFTEYVSEKKLTFASPQAGDDVRDSIFSQVDWTKPLTKEILGPLVDTTVEKKPYMLKQVTLGSTEGGRQSSNTEGVVEIDLDEVAASFGLPKPEKEQGSQ